MIYKMMHKAINTYVIFFLYIAIVSPIYGLNIHVNEINVNVNHVYAKDLYCSISRTQTPIQYIGFVRPVYYFPRYYVEFNVSEYENTCTVKLIGIDETGKRYNSTKVSVKITLYNRASFRLKYITDKIAVRPLINVLYKESIKMLYTYEKRSEISIDGKIFDAAIYINKTWNSIRWYDVDSGLLLKAIEYYAMATLDIQIRMPFSGNQMMPKEKFTDTGSFSTVLPPWMPGPDFNSARFDEFLWSKYFQIKEQLPNFTRMTINGRVCIVNNTRGIYFDVKNPNIFEKIADYLRGIFPIEDDLLIGATLFVSDPGVLFSPLRYLDIMDVIYFHGPEKIVQKILVENYDCTEILEKGYGVCGSKAQILAALFRALGYKSGTLSMSVVRKGIEVSHVVTALEKDNEIYIFDPMYQEFFYKLNNMEFATYNDIKRSPELIRRWGFLQHEGTIFNYTLDILYLNSKESDIFIQEKQISLYSSPFKIFCFFVLTSFFFTLLLLSVSTGVIRRRNRRVKNISIIAFSLSLFSLSYILGISNIYFSEIYITLGIFSIFASILSATSVMLFVYTVLRNQKKR